MNGLVILALVASTSACVAQGTIELPTDLQSPANRNKVDVHSLTGDPIRRWCTVQNAPLRAKPNRDAVEVGRLGFMEIIFGHKGAGNGYQSGDGGKGGGWCLVVRPKPGEQTVVAEILGWIESKFVLDAEKAALNDNGLEKKAMVVVKLELAAQIAKGARLEPLVPRLTAEPDGPQSEWKLRLFRILYIYAEMNNQLLVGKSSSFDPTAEANYRSEILGWIPQERVTRWDTRECVEWDRESAGHSASPRRLVKGRLYSDLAEAKADHDVLKQGDDNNGLGEVWDKDGEPIKVNYNRLRYPVLKTQRTVSPAEGALFTYKGNEAMQVGAVFSFHGADGKIIDQEEIARRQAQLEELGRQVSTTEVLFLIDDTESMDKWFPVAAAVVERIIEEVDREGAKVKAAVSFYNDGDNPVDAQRLLDLRIKSQQASLLQRLRTHTVHDGGDPLEKVFEGIRLSIDAARFSPNARKLVVLLGDRGDKGDPTLSQEERLNGIAKQLVPDDQELIEFHVLQVCRQDIDNDTKLFASQLNEQLRIAYRRRLQAVFKNSNVPDDQVLVTYTENPKPADVASVVMPKFQKAKAIGYSTKRLIDKAVLEGLPPEITEATDARLRQLFQREGVLEFVKNNGIQPFQEMYLWKYSPVKVDGQYVAQLRKRILATQFQVRKVMQLINRLENAVVKAGSRTKPEDVVTQVLNTTTGDDALFQSKDELKKFITAMQFESAFLEEFTASKVMRFDIQTRKRLLKVARLLQDALDEKHGDESQYEWTPIKSGGVEHFIFTRKLGPNGGELERKDEPRLFSLSGKHGGDEEMYLYIDVAREWP